MKKTIVISGIALSAVIAAQSAYAVAGNKEDRAAMRNDKQTEVAEKKRKRKRRSQKKKQRKCASVLRLV